MGAYLKHLDEVEYLEDQVEGELIPVPGLGKAKRTLGRNKFLGVDEKNGPWFYLAEHPAGSYVPMHKHVANRIEFILEGEIEFREQGKEPQIYGKHSFSYVTAGTLYEYKVLKDTKILIWFDGKPEINYL